VSTGQTATCCLTAVPRPVFQQPALNAVPYINVTPGSADADSPPLTSLYKTDLRCVLGTNFKALETAQILSTVSRSAVVPHPTSYAVGSVGPFPAGQAAWPPKPNASIKNIRSCDSTHTSSSWSRYLLKHGNDCTFNWRQVMGMNINVSILQ